ncbi:uncharacterized protein ccdc166 isoform X2 [Hypomesus transpacificus]|uniref:uncharacterized protein ccdc166 isoform X2 n=1 Tax=Hypomesus transpacificus TaxID=137520 RepID=UPI001F0730CB|nr:uncharacterized protein ccdc166 isoform X2 [Hypomesus transpacificus]
MSFSPKEVSEDGLSLFVERTTSVRPTPVGVTIQTYPGLSCVTTGSPIDSIHVLHVVYGGQQLGRIAELEREGSSMRCLHSKSLQALKVHFLSEKERYERQVKHRVQALTLAANREALLCLHTHTREVSEENQRLRSELLVLIRRAQALRARQEQLQAQRQALLMEREYVRELQRLRAALLQYHLQTQGGANTPEDKDTHRH